MTTPGTVTAAPEITASTNAGPATTTWVELLDTQVRLLRGRYRTRILEAGQGPALVLLHGTGGHLENWVRNIPRLSRHFHVIALDFLWHGRSQTEDFDPELIPPLVDQVTDVMDVLGIETAAVEGQSLGGWVAMQLALRHPERVGRLVLTTTMGFDPAEGAIPGFVEPNWASNLAGSLDVLRNPTYDNVRTRMTRILADPERITDEAILIRQALYRQPALAAVQQRFITEYQTGDAVRRHRVSDPMAGEIACPTLVYWGDHNRTPPAYGRYLADRVRDGRFHCAADTGHWAQFESAEQHDAVVTAFLLGVDSVRGTATGHGTESEHLMEHDHCADPVRTTGRNEPMADVTGRWDIVSWVQDFDDGRQVYPLGEELEGFIRYTPDGDMVCLIARADRTPFTTGGQWNAADVEKAAAYSSVLAYAGTYDIEGDTVVHHVDLSLFPNWEGGDQRRRFILREDGTLALEARLEDGTAEARTARLVWRRPADRAA